MTERIPLPGLSVGLPVPPDLLETFGYGGDARFVAVYWSPCGDEVVCADGRSSGTGQSWAFLAYRRHRAVAPLLVGLPLGYSDEAATHCLVFDRTSGRASVAPLAEAQAFLQAQHPTPPPLSPEEAEVLRQRIETVLDDWCEQRGRAVDMGEVVRAMTEQRGRVGRMVAWLDMCPVPPRGRES